MIELLSMGAILGLSAGLSPGPLLTLIIAETLRHDIRAGIKVAISPFFTDLPIIALTLTILSQLTGFHRMLGIISLVGGCLVLYMGYESMFPKPVAPDLSAAPPRSLAKGILVNALSPHPYLFWLGIGGPLLGKAMADGGITLPIAFIISFYCMLVGSKIALAVLVGKSKGFLSGTVYIVIMRILGAILCALAILLFRDGLRLLGVV